MICNDFFGKYKDVFGDVPFEKIATEIILKPNNFLAEGNSKKVFIIDRIKNFLLYLKKEEFNSASMLQLKSFPPIEDPIPEYNFGQPFASNSQGLYLSRKINGETHSLPN